MPDPSTHTGLTLKLLLLRTFQVPARWSCASLVGLDAIEVDAHPLHGQPVREILPRSLV